MQIVLAAHGHDVLAHARVVLHHMRTDLCRGRATANRTRNPLRRQMPDECFPHAQPCHRTIVTARTSDISNCHCSPFLSTLLLFNMGKVSGRSRSNCALILGFTYTPSKWLSTEEANRLSSAIEAARILSSHILSPLSGK